MSRWHIAELIACIVAALASGACAGPAGEKIIQGSLETLLRPGHLASGSIDGQRVAVRQMPDKGIMIDLVRLFERRHYQAVPQAQAEEKHDHGSAQPPLSTFFIFPLAAGAGVVPRPRRAERCIPRHRLRR